MSRVIPVAVLISCAFAAGETTTAAPVPPPMPLDEQERLLARCKKFAEQGKIDLYVAATAGLKIKADDLRQWQPAADFSKKLIERTGLKRDDSPLNTPANYNYKDFATYLGRAKPVFTRKNEVYFRPDPDPGNNLFRSNPNEVIQAPGVVDPKAIGTCLILSRGDVQTVKYGITSSVIFANGNVTAQTAIDSNVIVCDGDVTSVEDNYSLSQSVIIARGNITSHLGGGPVLMAGGKIVFRNNKPVNVDPLIVENKPNTLGVIFFELSAVGLEVKAADRVVRVTAVAAGKPCDKAKLKVGDAILEVSGKKPTDAESLRRLLRDALALGDATVKIQRGEKTETVKVVLPE